MNTPKFSNAQRVCRCNRQYNRITKETTVTWQNGTVIETALPGEHVSGTSKGLEIRYRVKWDGGPRTWFRESALLPMNRNDIHNL